MTAAAQVSNPTTALTNSLGEAGFVTTGASGQFCFASVTSKQGVEYERDAEVSKTTANWGRMICAEPLGYHDRRQSWVLGHVQCISSR